MLTEKPVLSFSDQRTKCIVCTASIACITEIMEKTNLRQLFIISHIMYIRILFIWLACAWKSYNDCAYSLRVMLLKYTQIINSILLLANYLPCRLMASNSKVNLRVFVVLSAAGIFSLYPLLFRSTGKKENFQSRCKFYSK